MNPRTRNHQWRRLCLAADEEVRRLVHALPPEVRQKAEALPVTYEPVPTPDMVEEGIAEDTLGLFIGDSFAEGWSGGDPLPQQIILFLESIWDAVEHDTPQYRHEVRRTYLHELGHYLGLDELDLMDRDLD